MKNIQIIISVFLYIMIQASLNAQIRTPELDKQAEIIEPVGFNPSRSYPLLVIVPPTTMTTRNYYNYYLRHENFDNVLIMLLPGTYYSGDYLPNFAGFVGWFNEMFQREFDKVFNNYKIDMNKISICGYSLGGDLTWALNALNPDLFCGIHVGGSRCSYPVSANNLAKMRSRGFRAAFYMGGSDSSARINGNKNARDLMNNSGIEVRYEESAGSNHENIADQYFTINLKWITGTNE